MAKRRRPEPLEAEPWEQLPEESASQYEKFCAYRDMRYVAQSDTKKPGDINRPDLAIRRSIRGLADQLGLKKETIGNLSSRFRWVERAEAYDAEILRKLKEKNEADIVKMRDTHALIAAQMLKKVTQRLLTLPENEITASDIARLADVAVKIERLSRGEATENQQVSGEITTVSKGGLDLSRLTDEELRQLAALGGEANDPAGRD